MSGSQFDIPSLSVSANRNRAAPSPANEPRPEDPMNDLQLPEQLTSKRRGRTLWVVGLLVLAALVGAYFRFFATSKSEHPYRVSPVEKRAIRQTVEAFGSLDVLSRVYVPASRAGQLTNIAVKRGQLVEAGQELAKLDPT